MLRPRQWACWLGMGRLLGFETLQRSYDLPDVPTTRFEYIEALAFAAKEDTDGDLRAV